ncbi:UNVERIFIED_CONTAM: hypothetical protein HDU68_009310 [Siphonaria sp. JEL0065]|nr:hypothetical protein HDU68_009310 [Siphonaria sp. JEL0065]
MGICADYAMYIHHAHARLSPGFTPETLSSKVGSCPKSTYLHSEHLTKTLLHIPNVRNWWIPNIEQILEQHAVYVPHMHKFLCKTQITCKLLAQYFRTNKIHDKSPVDAPLKFMSHSSPDVKKDLDARKMPFYIDYSRFFHSYGSSGRKNTPALIECWKRHPEWPRLTIVGNKDKKEFGFTDDNVPTNMRIYSRLPIGELRDLQMRNGIHLCPSQMEGYGHYINEARSLGALVVTTDAAPMNEMVFDGVNGILIYHDKGNLTTKTFPPQFMYEVYLTADEICSAVERVLAIELESRVFLGREGRVAYDLDTNVMEQNMALINNETLLHLYQDGWKQDSKVWEWRLREMDKKVMQSFKSFSWNPLALFFQN